MLKVSDEELEARRAKWQPREPKVTTGYLARYAKMVTSAEIAALFWSLSNYRPHLTDKKEEITRMQLNGSQIVMECLQEQGVDTVFGYPGRRHPEYLRCII